MWWGDDSRPFALRKRLQGSPGLLLTEAFWEGEEFSRSSELPRSCRDLGTAGVWALGTALLDFRAGMFKVALGNWGTDRH